jgi:DUF4097 and DUF4098 domain-containing protein YvlB
MLTTLAAITIATLAVQGTTDTTVAVPAGASLSVNNFGGAIIVRGWSQNSVKVHAEHSRRGRVEVSVVGSTVTVKAGSRQGAPSVVDMEITVPQAMPLTLGGTYAEITVEGVTGPIRAETVEGEVNVRGGRGNVTLSSIQGSVTLADASGRIEVTSVNEDIDLSNVSGEIKIEATNGEVTMTGIRSSSVEAATINGDVVYDGTINDGGSYSFTSHNGDITVTIPERANVTITGATANGDIDASFPLPMTSTTGKRRYNFKLGTGSARLEVESFQGDIQLRRPGEVQVDRQPKNPKGHDSNHELNFDFDFDFDFKFDSANVGYAARYAAKYAAQYAPKYAREYAPRYAKMYSRLYRQYSQ